MPKEEWGVKRSCPNCSTRFYDLMNDPMTCPNCDETFTLESLSASSKVKISDSVSSKAKPAEVDDLDADDVLDDDDSVTLDDDILDEDDDDTVDLDDIADVPADDEN